MSDPRPLVGICMGSTSDLPVMSAAAEILRGFEIPHEVRIISAHRTPSAMVEYGRSAAERGLEVLIAGAAHLPGMLAALTPLPVIGVPVPLARLDGLDSLLSIVQMPKGTPVATVAIGQAANAAHLAARILGVGRRSIRAAIEEYQRQQEAAVTGQDAEVATSFREGDGSSPPR